MHHNIDLPTWYVDVLKKEICNVKTSMHIAGTSVTSKYSTTAANVVVTTKAAKYGGSPSD